MLTPDQAAKIRKSADNLSENARRFRTEGQSHHEKGQADEEATTARSQPESTQNKLQIFKRALQLRLKTILETYATKDEITHEDNPLKAFFRNLFGFLIAAAFAFLPLSLKKYCDYFFNTKPTEKLNDLTDLTTTLNAPAA